MSRLIRVYGIVSSIKACSSARKRKRESERLRKEYPLAFLCYTVAEKKDTLSLGSTRLFSLQEELPFGKLRRVCVRGSVWAREEDEEL